MTDKIAEIRARHERDNRYGDGLYPGAHKDRAWLLAEVERLRAQTVSLDEFRIALDTANAHVDTLVTEKARLKEQLDLAAASRVEALAVVADQRNQIGALRAEIETIIAGFDMLAEKIGDQFLFEQSEPIQMVREEIYNVLRESPRWREAAGQRAARAVLHARKPDPNEEDV